MRKLAFVLCILLLLAGCSAAEELSSSSAAATETAVASRDAFKRSQPESASEPVPADPARQELDALIEDAHYVTIVPIADLYVLIGSRSDAAELGCPYRMMIPGEFDRTIHIPHIDSTFSRSIYVDGYPVEVSVKPFSKKVHIRVQKHNYYLDFETGTYEYELRYRVEDLYPDDPIALSPDGTLGLYQSYMNGGGEARWGDMMVREEGTANVWLLTAFSGRPQVFFVDQNTVFLNHYSDLVLLDVHTGEPLPTQPAFDFDETFASDRRELNRFIVGSIFDPQQNKLLLAYIVKEQGDVWPVGLAVCDLSAGSTVYLETEWKMDVYRGPAFNEVELELLGNGQVRMHTHRLIQQEPMRYTWVDFEPVVLGEMSY